MGVLSSVGNSTITIANAASGIYIDKANNVGFTATSFANAASKSGVTITNGENNTLTFVSGKSDGSTALDKADLGSDTYNLKAFDKVTYAGEISATHSSSAAKINADGIFALHAKTLTISGSGLTLSGNDSSAGHDKFSIDASKIDLQGKLTVDLGSGTDSFELAAYELSASGGTLTLTNVETSNIQVINLDAKGSATISGAVKNDIAINTIKGTGAVAINGGTGDDIFKIGEISKDAGALTINASDGNDTFTIGNVLSTGSTLSGGAGNDTFTINGSLSLGTGTFTIDGGAGDDKIILAGKYAESVTVASGNTAATGVITVNAGSGSDTLDISGFDFKNVKYEGGLATAGATAQKGFAAIVTDLEAGDKIVFGSANDKISLGGITSIKAGAITTSTSFSDLASDAAFSGDAITEKPNDGTASIFLVSGTNATFIYADLNDNGKIDDGDLVISVGSGVTGGTFADGVLTLLGTA